MRHEDQKAAKHPMTPVSEREKGSHQANQPEIRFPIVGIGASAGGLAAFEAFFAQIPANTGIAFVLVQHLLPEHKSNLSQLIQPLTGMQVCEAEDQMIIERDCIYIIPPNRLMGYLNGRLTLSKQAASMPQFSIDFFFNSLADSLLERSICIVLSGAGTDGTLGMEAVKAAGGMTIVQDPDSAQFKSMPNSAISTGLADYVLPPHEMPDQLIAYTQLSFGQSTTILPPDSTDSNSLQRVLAILYQQTGQDFSNYKHNTISRRINHRMAFNHIDRLDDYVHYLEQNSSEVDILFREFLIGVTSFFRDSDSFEAVKKQIIPYLFKDKTYRDTIRIWVPGCSTGEEAYSLAILLSEYMEEAKQPVKIQIFASDIDNKALDKARNGIYPIHISSTVSAARLKLFFTLIQEGTAYQVHKSIRDMVIFAQQSVTEDPPFSRLDMISCRNLLIYFDLELQRKVLRLFHYALNHHGFLYLGSSETTGELMDLFTVVDRKNKLYQSKPVALHHLTVDGKLSSIRKSTTSLRPFYGGSPKGVFGIRDLVESELLRRFAPACVVIDKQGEIIYTYGSTGKYLELSPGETRINILQMARPGLKLELSNAIKKVTTQKESYHYPALEIETKPQPSIIDLTVSLIAEGSPAFPGLILVVFEDVSPDGEHLQEVAVTTEQITDPDRKYEILEWELQKNDDYLRITIEELGISVEELQSANEQLQCTNEELETSKEELQSVNEELLTVNADLIRNIDDLSTANNDINNMLTGTGVSIVFVDQQLRIKRFTSIADQIIHLIPNDLGRPIHHIATNLVGYYNLEQDLLAVLNTLIPKSLEVQTRNGLFYLMRILPYRKLNNVIDGAVISFIDITEQKRLLEAENRLAIIVRDSSDAIIMYDLMGQITGWNLGAHKMYGWTETEAKTMSIEDITPENKKQELKEMMNKLSHNELIKPFQTQRISKSRRIIDVWLIVSILVNEHEEPYAITTIERYI